MSDKPDRPGSSAPSDATVEDKWNMVDEVGLTFNDQAAKEMAFQLGLTPRLVGPDEALPQRPANLPEWGDDVPS